MTNEFRHASVGDELSQTEWEGIGTHIFNNQATGDILYASSATQLSRLGIGSTNNILTVSSGIPAWTATPTLSSLTLSGTTALTFGTNTTAINVAANTVIPNLINVGTSANPLHWDGVASNILVYQENLDTTPGSITANKFVLSAAQSAAVTSGRLECFRAVTTSYSTNAVTADMRALVGQTEFAGACTYQGSSTADFAGAYGVIASIYSGAAVTANTGNLGHLYPLGIFFGVETGSALSGDDAYIYIYNFGKFCPNSVIKLYNASTPQVPTYLIDGQGMVLGSSSGPFYTGDVNPTGATGDNALGADGHIKIIIGSTPYYIPIFGTLV